jgi:hypothetical protein
MFSMITNIYNKKTKGPTLTFWLRNLNGYNRPFAADIIFAGHLNFITRFTKNFIIPGTKKDLIMD